MRLWGREGEILFAGLVANRLLSVASDSSALVFLGKTAVGGSAKIPREKGRGLAFGGLFYAPCRRRWPP